MLNPKDMSNIVSIQRSSADIDVNSEFRNYKYAIPEHEPIKLSNGMWLHTYKVTAYNDHAPAGDEDVEQESFEREMYN